VDQALVNRITRFRAGNERLAQQVEYEKQTVVRLEAKIVQLEADKTLLVKAIGLIDRCIQVISANGISKIESIVTGGLRLVFNDPQLGLIVEKKEGKRGNSFELLMKKGDVVGVPMDTFGGGPCNIVSFLLRLILIKKFKLAKFIALDEAFNNVGKDGGDLTRTATMLRQLCDDHGFTLLITTHERAEAGLISAANNVYRVFIEDGKPPVLKKVNALEAQTENSGRDSFQLPGNDSSLSPPLAKAEPASVSPQL
jgi:DNA repair exonuclease SbcCD ATPase subunit